MIDDVTGSMLTSAEVQLSVVGRYYTAGLDGHLGEVRVIILGACMHSGGLAGSERLPSGLFWKKNVETSA